MTRAPGIPASLLFLTLAHGCYAPSTTDADANDTGSDDEPGSTAATDPGDTTANAEAVGGDDAVETSTGEIGLEDTTDPATDDGNDDGDDTTAAGTDTGATDDDGSDAGEVSSDDGSTGAPVDTSRIVFLLTEAGAPMAYDGLAGADAFCQQAADDAGLAGTFQAWLSATMNLSPSTRFEQGGGPFVRPDGVVIALDWPDLVDGTLAAPISVTAAGIEIDPSAMPETLVVTHTLHDGTFAGGLAPCASFTADIVVGPRRGTATATDVGWTENDDDWSCSNAASGGPSLYCFAQ